jgi:aminoglycoside phosphotransferase (APT) family kinase protein
MRITAAMFDPVAFLVEQRLLRDLNVTAKALTGGYLNQVTRVRGAGIDWVVKRFMPETELALFPNFPADEAEALKRASAHGLAPKPIGFFAGDNPVLVYEFCAGEVWQQGVGGVARLLRRLRDVDARGFREVPMAPADILTEGDASLPKVEAATRDRLVAARPVPLRTDPVQPSFLHTDIGPGNIIVTPDGRLVVIDWQCPAAGDPVQDMVAFLSPAFQILYGCTPLSAGQDAEFHQAYDDPATKERYDRMLPFYDWRMAGYCATRKLKYADTRPEASQRYDRALNALLARLEG